MIKIKPKEWHIWDLPSNLYVLVEVNTRNEFFEFMYKYFGSQKEYAKFLSRERNSVQKFHYARSWDNSIKHVSFTPLEIFQKSRHLISNEFQLRIQNSILEIRAHGGKSIKNPIFPIKESPTLYRIVAHVLGDGNDSHTPYYANMCKELREQFEKDLQMFGEVYYFENIPNTTPCINFPKTITRMLAHILNIQFTHPNRIPEAIFTASEDCKTAFLQALFDDEGTMSSNLAIGMNNSKIINQIKELLSNLNIETNKIMTQNYESKKGQMTMFIFQIRPKAYLKYKEKINFMHPKKKDFLDQAICAQNRKFRTRPQEYIEEKIFEILSTQSLNSIEIARKLQFTAAGVGPHLNRLKKQKEIIRKESGSWDLL